MVSALSPTVVSSCLLPLIGFLLWLTPSQRGSSVLSPSLALVTAVHRSSRQFFRAPSDPWCEVKFAERNGEPRWPKPEKTRGPKSHAEKAGPKSHAEKAGATEGIQSAEEGESALWWVRAKKWFCSHFSRSSFKKKKWGSLGVIIEFWRKPSFFRAWKMKTTIIH